jgi:hypothetical protein
MLNAAPSRLLAFFMILGTVPACLAQSHTSAHGTSRGPDTCPGPWHRAGFEGFKIGMRAPGGEECIYRDHLNPSGPQGYRRKTSVNEYAIQPSYQKDYTESRLHPATILASVRVEMDQASPIAELLSDLAEIRQMCAGGCRIVGLGRFRENSRFALFPENPTDEQQVWALRAASYLAPHDRPDSPVPVVYFYWEQKQECTRFDSGSLGWPIVRAEFTVADTSFLRERASKPPNPSESLRPELVCSGPEFIDLGELNP